MAQHGRLCSNMLIKIKDLYGRIFASANGGQTADQLQLPTRKQNSSPETKYRSTDSTRQTETIKDQAK